MVRAGHFIVDHHILRLFANYAGTAIEKARLYSKIREEKQELEVGALYRPVPTHEGAVATRMHAFEQTGEGVLPIVYWVTGRKRLFWEARNGRRRPLPARSRRSGFTAPPPAGWKSRAGTRPPRG